MPKTRTITNLTDEQREILLARIEDLKRIRQVCRTDLLWLCNNVLGYKDVSREVHGEMIDSLQKFKGGTEKFDENADLIYTPACEIWKLEGPRNRLRLWTRGTLKTTVITIAHGIQWMLNYPDIRMALSMAIGDQTQKVMSEVKGHFQFNEKFRQVFPDYCPSARGAKDFGSLDQFTIPKRSKHRKEPTLCLITVGKVTASAHYDVIKHSDLVDQVNVRTPGGISEVNQHFAAMNPLIERYSIKEGEEGTRYGWQDVEGTIYDFGDLHVKIVGGSGAVFELHESPAKDMPGGWNCIVRDSIKPDGTALWPDRWPIEELDRVKNLPEMSPQIFSCQYHNRPIPPDGGLCDPKDIVFIPRQVLSGIAPMLRLHCTIDLHGLEPAKNDNDYTVLSMCGFDRDGRLYVVDIRRGRYTPEQVIWQVFDLHARYPHCIDFKIEKDAHARVLLPFLQREASKRQRFPVMVPIRRDTHVSKQQRIRGLQPWFKAGIIRFADDLGCKTDLILEIAQFPSQSSGVHDDILDTLADQMQNQEGWVNDEMIADPQSDPFEQFGKQRAPDRFLGFNDDGSESWLYGPDERKERISMTGVM